MENDLTIEIDDALLAALTRRAAEEEGCDVEELAARLIAEAVREPRE